MTQTAERGAATAPLLLAAAAESLKNAVGWLTQAGMQIEAAQNGSDAAELLTEEVRDVLARVKAEREKLASGLPSVP